MAYKAADVKKWADDKAVTFGSNSDISISYDEAGDNGLLFKQGVEGAALTLLFQADQSDDAADRWAFGFADSGNFTISSKSSGSYDAELTLTNAGALTVDTSIASGTTLTAGTTLTVTTIAQIGSDTDKFLMSDGGVVKYVTGANLATYAGAVAVGSSSTFTGSNTFTNATGQIFQGTSGNACNVYFKADAGEDAGDEWKMSVADGGVITWGNDINSAGTYVTHMTFTPNATVASSTAAFAGHVTVAGNTTITGNLTVNGTTTTVDTTNLLVKDSLIGLNEGAGSNANDCGFIVERGSTGNNAILIWDESADKWTMGTGTAVPSETGNLSNFTAGTLVVGTLEGAVTGDVTGNADTATLATSVTVSANNNTDETVYPVFVDAATGTQGAETDTGLTYNPYSGLLTSTGFAGALSGNCSGTAATVTGAAQAAITSLGTLTTLTVDNLTINGNTITADSGALNLTPASGSTIVLDSTIIIDAGVVTGATSITSTAFVGALTGNASTATAATNVTVADESSDTTCFPLFATAATGDLGPKSGSNLTFNSSSGALSCSIIAATGAIGSGSTLTAGSTLTVTTIAAATSDLDTFLVSDGGVVKYRTGAEVASDIGAVSTSTANTFTAKQTIDTAAGAYTPSASDGTHLHIEGGVAMNDATTSASGTSAGFSQVTVEACSVTATNSSVTTANANTLFISGPPTAGSNMTLTNAWAMNAAGNVLVSGAVAGEGSNKLSLKNTNADAYGSELNFLKFSASAADSDTCGVITFKGKDDAANVTTFASISGVSAAVANGSEAGKIDFNVAEATSGALHTTMSIEQDEVTIKGYEGANATLNLYADEGDDNDDKNRIIGATESVQFQSYSSGAWVGTFGVKNNDAVGSSAVHQSFQTHSSGDFTAEVGDGLIFLTATATATVDLPSSQIAMTELGWHMTVKDSLGKAETYTLTIDAGSGNCIDNSQTKVLVSNYESVTLVLVSRNGTVSGGVASDLANGSGNVWSII